MPVEIDGWQLMLFNGCDTLDYCDYWRSPDGRVGTLELWQRDGADPVELAPKSLGQFNTRGQNLAIVATPS
jgi:hypothetical protein